MEKGASGKAVVRIVRETNKQFLFIAQVTLYAF